MSVTLFLYSFGYGGITSFTALYADASGATPKGIYLTALAIVILITRPLAGRLADRVGRTRVLLPCLGLISVGLAVPGLRWDARLAADVRDHLRNRLRHRVSRVRRRRHRPRRSRAPRRGVRRHARRVRHRHRHRVDQHGMDHRRIRVRGSVRRRRRCSPRCRSRISWSPTACCTAARLRRLSDEGARHNHTSRASTESCVIVSTATLGRRLKRLGPAAPGFTTRRPPARSIRALCVCP